MPVFNLSVASGAIALYRLSSESWAEVNKHSLLVAETDLGGLYTYQFMGTPSNVSVGIQLGPITSWPQLFTACTDWRQNLFQQIVAQAQAIHALAVGLQAFASAMLHKLGHHEPVTPQDLAELASLQVQANAIAVTSTNLEPSFIKFSDANAAAARDPQVQHFQVTYGALFRGLLDFGANVGTVVSTAQSVMGEWEAFALQLGGSYEALAAVQHLDTITNAVHLEAAAGEWGDLNQAVTSFLSGAATQIDSILGCGSYIYADNAINQRWGWAIANTGTGLWVLTAGEGSGSAVTWQRLRQGPWPSQVWCFNPITEGLGYWNITNAGTGTVLGLDSGNGNKSQFVVNTPLHYAGQWWRLYGTASSGLRFTNMLNGAGNFIAFTSPGAQVSSQAYDPNNERQVLTLYPVRIS
jgi:hypothetical protein